MAVNFKDEEEVKEYLQNIGIEYRFACFKEKNAEGCHLLGDYLEAIKYQFDAAAKVYKMNCDELKYAKSCFKYGNFCFLGKGIEKNYPTAYEYFKKACDLNDVQGCLHAGTMLTVNYEKKEDKNLVIEANPVEGFKLLDKACSAGNSLACYFASGLCIKGADGIPKDRTKASHYSQLACDGGNIYACMNLSQMYRYGDGVEKNDKKADEFKARAKEIRDGREKKPIGLQQYI